MHVTTQAYSMMIFLYNNLIMNNLIMKYCNVSISQVYAIIVSKPEKGELSPASVSYTAGALKENIFVNIIFCNPFVDPTSIDYFSIIFNQSTFLRI